MFERDATILDAEKIAVIHRAAREKAMPWLPVLHSKEQDFHYFANTVIPNQAVRVICTKDDITGFAAYEDGWLHHLYVHPDRWRCGVGLKLLTSAKRYNAVVQLWTFQRNSSARAFYSFAGFKEAELTNGEGNEEKTPDVRLFWKREN